MRIIFIKKQFNFKNKKIISWERDYITKGILEARRDFATYLIHKLI
jgi:hypothetical protein